ncbi:hypothetical protein CDAR_374751 [Caerostris darwini]|uniref:Uncharacterized protein n=1 Tax=Caerostris darwini TaxID=1538125 RepID=A0AAV4P7X6_9ARAC|nr:hypothetical protein CDAR_374751 [Caerostris darwini]
MCETLQLRRNLILTIVDPITISVWANILKSFRTHDNVLISVEASNVRYDLEYFGFQNERTEINAFIVVQWQSEKVRQQIWESYISANGDWFGKRVDSDVR